MIDLPGYKFEREIGRGKAATVYRAARDGQLFAIKVLHADVSVDVQAGLRFRKEGASVARLNHKGVVKIAEIGEHQRYSYLVMDYVQGQTLEELLRSQRLTQEQTVRIAVSIVDALVEVHRHGMVHRDLKPANILINGEFEATLIDFGLATGVQEQNGADTEKDREIVGTFLYAPAEQSGMLKRPVDNRSDLYAVGAVLYECLTGEPPYKAENLNELLRMHAAAPVPSARERNPEVSAALSAVVSKLLAKDPDDRYPTAAALLFDLQHLDELEAHLSVGALKLGFSSAATRAVHEISLVGREIEHEVLRRLWARAQERKGAAVQVEGEAGSGKTRLIRELTQEAIASGATVLSGKAQKGDAIPLGAIREAIEVHLNQVLRAEGMDGAGVARIREAAGEFGSVVSRLSRALAKVLAGAPDAGQLDPTAERDRFYDNVAQFFVNLAQLSGPTLLHIDDLQWLDAGSLEVLRRIGARFTHAPLMIAATLRSDEASSTEAGKVLADILSDRVVLRPLDVQGVGQLVSLHLGSASIDDALIGRLHTVTRGNPFAVEQFVTSMMDAGMLRPHRGQWTVDAEQLQALTLSSDVSRLIVDRITALPDDTVHTLRVAALMGVKFRREALTLATGLPEQEVSGALEEAMRHHLVERRDGDLYSFVHDRLVEALTGSVEEATRRDLHQAIALGLDRLEDSGQDHAYALARHYSLGHVEAHRQRVYETNLLAGRLALEAYANAEAHLFLDRARHAGDGVVAEAELRVLFEQLAVACWRIGRQDEACEYFERVLKTERSKLSRARVHYLAAETRMSQGKVVPAWEQVEKALAELDTSIPKSMFGRFLFMFWRWAVVVFLRKTGIGFGSAQGEQRQRRALLRNLMEVGGNIHYWLGQPLVYGQMIIHQVYHAHFMGHSPELALAHGYYSKFWATVGIKSKTAYYGKLSIEVARQLGDRNIEFICRTMYEVLSAEWAGLLSVSRHTHPDVLVGVRKFCGPYDLGRCAVTPGMHLSYSGGSREAVDLGISRQADLVKAGNIVFLTGNAGSVSTQLLILGRKVESLKWLEELERLAASAPDVVFVQVTLHLHRIWQCLENEEFGDELEKAIASFYALACEGGADDYYDRVGYVLIGYARVEQLLRARGRERAHTLKLLKLAARRAMLRALTAVHKCHYLVLRAAIAREEGRYTKAYALLKQAETLADEAESAWGRFAVHKERARLAGARDDASARNREAEVAFDIADRLGWKLRQAQLRREFGLESYRVPALAGGTSSTSGATSRSLSSHTRYAQALLQVSLASASQMDPKKQAQAALDEVVRLLGAERAFLFVTEPGQQGLQLAAGRDAAGNPIHELKGYSSTVVERVKETRQPLVVTGTEEGEAIGSESAVANALRSIVSVPLLMRDALVGVLYLDSRVAKGLFGEEDVEILLAIGNHIAIALETSRVARMEAERRVLEKDLALTAAVQTYFLPKKTVHRAGGLHLAGHSRSAAQCGGDWWWYGDRSSDALWVLVGDVTGHGAAPAMLTVSVATALRMSVSTGTQPLREVLEQLHQNLQVFANGEYQMTMAAIEVDRREGKLRAWFAGAPPFLIMNAAGEISPLSGSSSPLGSDALQLGFAEAVLKKGDRLFLFTDGLVELALPSGRRYGIRRVSELLKGVRGMSPEASVGAIMQQVDEARGTAPLQDDLTFAIIDLEDEPERNARVF